jgi:hypothetical protein
VILPINPTEPKRVQQRLTAFGVDLEGDGWEPRTHCIGCYVEAPLGANLTTTANVGVRRNAVLVSLDPRLGEAVGYQPAAPTLLNVGYWGAIQVSFKTQEDAALAFSLLGGAPAVTLSLVPVTAPD